MRTPPVVVSSTFLEETVTSNNKYQSGSKCVLFPPTIRGRKRTIPSSQERYPTSLRACLHLLPLPFGCSPFLGTRATVDVRALLDSFVSERWVSLAPQESNAISCFFALEIVLCLGHGSGHHFDFIQHYFFGVRCEAPPRGKPQKNNGANGAPLRRCASAAYRVTRKKAHHGDITELSPSVLLWGVCAT